ncbi:hypothetical protein HanRHA438_Chr14g0651391 [Helianthus annuus]|nr:hypothetical protein HanRHA438_Chr14g0651391 [Helianthus annuus]
MQRKNYLKKNTYSHYNIKVPVYRTGIKLVPIIFIRLFPLPTPNPTLDAISLLLLPPVIAGCKICFPKHR